MPPRRRRYRPRRLHALQNDPELLVIRPAPTSAGLNHFQPFNLSTVLIAVHKDCYTALTLIRQGGPHRRKTIQLHHWSSPIIPSPPSNIKARWELAVSRQAPTPRRRLRSIPKRKKIATHARLSCKIEHLLRSSQRQINRFRILHGRRMIRASAYQVPAPRFVRTATSLQRKRSGTILSTPARISTHSRHALDHPRPFARRSEAGSSDLARVRIDANRGAAHCSHKAPRDART